MKKISSAKILMFYSALFTFIWGIIAHGYCYFNSFFSHDSMFIFQNDVSHQIGLGRFLHPVYFQLRGNIFAPALVGFLSLSFIALSVAIVCMIFDEKRPLMVCLFSGIMTTNSVVTLTNATYLHDSDIYMLSLLCAVAAVYFTQKSKFGWIASIALLVISLALYQSYFSVAIFLFMVLIIFGLLDGKDFKESFLTGLKYVGILIGGLVLYYVIMKGVLWFTGTPLSTAYNGLSEIGKYDGIKHFIKTIINTYKNIIYTFIIPRVHHIRLIRYINLFLLLFAAYAIIWIIIKRKIKAKEVVLTLLLCLILPFGCNFTCFISQGMVHDLMTYSFCMVYVFILLILKMYFSSATKSKTSTQKFKDNKVMAFIRYGIPALVCVIIFNSIIYSNQLYEKKQLEYDSTLALVNRIVDRMEQTEGYLFGETKVVFVGNLENSEFNFPRQGFELPGTGAGSSLSLTYDQTYGQYFKYILNYPINLCTAAETEEWTSREDVQQMNAFPNLNCCKVIDNVLVVKLSEINP